MNLVKWKQFWQGYKEAWDIQQAKDKDRIRISAEASVVLSVFVLLVCVSLMGLGLLKFIELYVGWTA